MCIDINIYIYIYQCEHYCILLLESNLFVSFFLNGKTELVNMFFQVATSSDLALLEAAMQTGVFFFATTWGFKTFMISRDDVLMFFS